MFDPQTSGGLLISVAPENAGALLTSMNNAEIPGAKIGRVVEGKAGIVLY
jgi:selenide,water dikinase